MDDRVRKPDTEQFTVSWHDSGREPQCAPDPQYPEGIDVDPGVRPACRIELPYPAKRCGRYEIQCQMCGCRLVITTAGRPDDPRSVMVPCRPVAGEA